MAELAFAAAAVEDTYAVADVAVGVGLHNWYKLNKNTNGMVHYKCSNVISFTTSHCSRHPPILHTWD